MKPELVTGKILVVDDNESNRYTLNRYLKVAGYEVVEAANGKDGLRLAGEKPALIILDIQLPDMTGFEACRKLKSSPVTAAIPVLHTSASFKTIQDKTSGLEGGADAYLTSPLEPEELVATVKALIRMRRAEVEAQRLADEWQNTFDAIGNGICLVREDGTIQRHNEAFHSILGKPEVSLVGRSLDSVLAEALVPESPMPRMWQTRRHQVTETRRAGRYLRITADPIADENGSLNGAVCVLHDVTERREQEAELQVTKEKLRLHAEDLELRVAERTASLKERNESLEDFCYSIAHDLQAPLRAVNGFTSLIESNYGDKLDETGKGYARRIVSEAGRMQRLVKDLLEYGKLTHTEVACGRVELTPRVKAVLDRFEEEIKAVDAEILVEGTLPVVCANAMLLDQVLENLMENAIKFVPPGRRPRVRIYATANGGAVRLWVEDNGIGIAEEHFVRIFSIFERLHGAKALYSGTGIGLAIVRKAMERMGGQVGVESQADKGSKFWLEFRP